MRWCFACHGRHAGAENLSTKPCEDCHAKAASCGIPNPDAAKSAPRGGTKNLRWCASCAKSHSGAENLSLKRCEDCNGKQASFGIPAEGTRRWCFGCAKAHSGAMNLRAQKRCEDCYARWQQDPSQHVKTRARSAWVGGTRRMVGCCPPTHRPFRLSRPE